MGALEILLLAFLLIFLVIILVNMDRRIRERRAKPPRRIVARRKE